MFDRTLCQNQCCFYAILSSLSHWEAWYQPHIRLDRKKKSLHDRFERLFDVFEVSRCSLWSLILPFTEQQHHSTMVSNAQLLHFKGFCQMRAIQIRAFGMCLRLPCVDRRKDLKWWHNHVNLLIKFMAIDMTYLFAPKWAYSIIRVVITHGV